MPRYRYWCRHCGEVEVDLPDFAGESGPPFWPPTTGDAGLRLARCPECDRKVVFRGPVKADNASGSR